MARPDHPEQCLGESDVFEICGYLHGLNKRSILSLGLCLGLNYAKVEDMLGSQTYREDIIAAWIQRQDQVLQKSGVPTWHTLVKALENPQVGQGGIARDISRDKNIPACSSTETGLSEDQLPAESEEITISSLSKGQTLQFQSRKKTIQVEWQQWFFQRSQTYVLCEYMLNGKQIPVYIQQGYSIPENLTVDSRLQYGSQSGIMFLVYHDKSQKPFQHRFIAELGSSWLKQYTYGVLDPSAYVGEYLHDV